MRKFYLLGLILLHPICFQANAADKINKSIRLIQDNIDHIPTNQFLTTRDLKNNFSEWGNLKSKDFSLFQTRRLYEHQVSTLTLKISTKENKFYNQGVYYDTKNYENRILFHFVCNRADRNKTAFLANTIQETYKDIKTKNRWLSLYFFASTSNFEDAKQNLIASLKNCKLTVEEIKDSFSQTKENLEQDDVAEIVSIYNPIHNNREILAANALVDLSSHPTLNLLSPLITKNLDSYHSPFLNDNSTTNDKPSTNLRLPPIHYFFTLGNNSLPPLKLPKNLPTLNCDNSYPTQLNESHKLEINDLNGRKRSLDPLPFKPKKMKGNIKNDTNKVRWNEQN